MSNWWARGAFVAAWVPVAVACGAGDAEDTRAGGSAVANGGPFGRPPNVVVILTDDQRHDAIGVVQREQGDAGRFPFFRDQTPNIDRLAAGGLRFRNAFVVNSLCSPSRAVFLTSRYNHLNGVANNDTPLPRSSVTYASELNDAGWVTGYFGKWHMGRQAARPGFDHYASFLGQGEYEDCPLMVDGEEKQTKGWVDDVTTDHAIDFIKDRVKKDQRFVTVLAFKSPHGPRVPPARMKKRFADVKYAPAPNAESAPPYVPEADRKPHAPGGEDLRDYFRVLAAVDENVGRVLDTLDETGVADDTVVVYASDNGYFLGEHERGDKRLAYEESIRIPFIVRYPRLPQRGITVDATVLNLDLAPTLLSLAGRQVPAAMQGTSLVPLLGGTSPKVRDGFLYEYFREDGYDPPTILAWRGDAEKVTTYPGHPEWREVFDLAADPFEMKNLSSDPASAERVTGLMSRLDDAKKETRWEIPAWADK